MLTVWQEVESYENSVGRVLMLHFIDVLQGYSCLRYFLFIFIVLKVNNTLEPCFINKLLFVELCNGSVINIPNKSYHLMFEK